MINDCTAIILAGGASTRMGQDKALLRFGEEPLLHRAVRQMKACFATQIISVREHKTLSHASLQVHDVGKAHGPMTGIATAMNTMTTAWSFVLACDMPFISLSLIRAMAKYRQQQDTIIPMGYGVMQPLFGFYAKDCLPTLQAHLKAGQYSIKKMVKELNTTIIDESTCRHHDPKLLSFFDLDTAEDVARALLLAKKEGNFSSFS
ncbi:MAG: molybdenum cofactor guanylyltransferase [Mariprofundaceae bacterium]|nr:molybdenum cofactor guanylyltransferase [Mariprofundaceae bacterium]